MNLDQELMNVTNHMMDGVFEDKKREEPMRNEIATIDQFTPEVIDVIKRTIAPGLTPDELTVFLHNCVKTGLDPMAKQIYAIKRGGRMCIQTGIDGFRLIAERSGKYAPGKDTEFLRNDKGYLVGAKVYVKKMTPDGTWHDLSAVALMDEYNANQGLWKKMPSVMIEKCAEARALRRAFPADLSGIYSADEMEQADGVENPTGPVKMIPEPFIDKDTYASLEVFLNGHDDLRDKLKQLCNVEDLRYIKKSQLEACRKYAKTYKERLDVQQDEDENEGPSEE